ncbi:MAG TPA: CBS domain-containing protein [Casimicrobiaceae bacterium]|nr:CBS domain-containing protein [Casimicrobiaceae bacterium]
MEEGASGTGMFDRLVKEVMQKSKVLKAPPETLVSKAAKLMAKKNVGAVMVVVGERLVGIFTERDVVFRVVAQSRDANATRLADVMTPSPEVVAPNKPLGYALSIMHEKGFRHLPVIEHGRILGIVSARSAMDPELEDFVSEARRREHFRQLG